MPRRGTDGHIHSLHHESQQRRYSELRGCSGLYKKFSHFFKKFVPLTIPTSHSAANESIKSGDKYFYNQPPIQDALQFTQAFYTSMEEEVNMREAKCLPKTQRNCRYYFKFNHCVI